MSLSPLAPAAFPDIDNLPGLVLATAASGLKYTGRDDMLLMRLGPQAQVAAVFTQSDTAAAPVQWSRSCLAADAAARALLVNAGNANAFTGTAGMQTVEQTSAALAAMLGCDAGHILVASTGVIGEPLDSKVLERCFPALLDQSETQTAAWQAAALAIMTTDTFPKGATASCMIGDTPVTISGIAKGSGMIAPDMATMLGFIATDASLPGPVLAELLTAATKRSFNAITVDSDTSTNDSVFLIATGAAQTAGVEHADDPALAGFISALDTVMQDLATQIVRDGEGATKFITIDVTGAKDDAAAHAIGMAIANSPLVKTAIAGEDANWGRIVMAIGKTGAGIDQASIGIAIGGVPIAADGGRVEDYDETPVAIHMQGESIDIAVTVGAGSGTARVWTCDLTHGYISINADYRS